MRHRLFERDRTVLVQSQQCFIKILHAFLTGILERVLHLGDLSLQNQVLDMRRIDHQFNSGYAFTSAGTYKTLRQNRTQVVTEVHKYLRLLLRWKQVDDSIQRFGRIVRV